MEEKHEQDLSAPFVDGYTLYERLGKSNYSVYKAIKRDTNEELALKCIQSTQITENEVFM